MTSFRWNISWSQVSACCCTLVFQCRCGCRSYLGCVFQVFQLCVLQQFNKKWKIFPVGSSSLHGHPPGCWADLLPGDHHCCCAVHHSSSWVVNIQLVPTFTFVWSTGPPPLVLNLYYKLFQSFWMLKLICPCDRYRYLPMNMALGPLLYLFLCVLVRLILKFKWSSNVSSWTFLPDRVFLVKSSTNSILGRFSSSSCPWITQPTSLQMACWSFSSFLVSACNTCERSIICVSLSLECFFQDGNQVLASF